MLRHSRGPRRPASYSARSPSIRPLVGNAQARRLSPQDGGLWACGGLPERWELVAVLRPITALGARTCHFPPPFNSSHQVSFTSASSRADRACLERAGRGQSANGRLRDPIGAGQLCLRRALREALHGLTALMGRERRRATEAHALRLRAVAAGAGSGEDQLALELGQPAEHG